MTTLTTALSNLQSQITSSSNGGATAANDALYNNFYNSVMSSTQLQNYLTNSLQTSNQLSGFNYVTTGDGTYFNPTTHNIDITNSFLTQLTNLAAAASANPQVSATLANVVALSSTIFTIGHEDWHSTTINALSGPGGTGPTLLNTIAQDASSGNSTGLNSAVNSYVQAYVSDESQANIQGWNTVIYAAVKANNGPLNTQQITQLEQNADGQQFFFNSSGQSLSGIKVNSDGTISASSTNVTAEAVIEGETVASTYGGTLTYNQLYAAPAISYAMENADGNVIQINVPNIGTLVNGTQLSDAQVVQNMQLVNNWQFPPTNSQIIFSDGGVATFNTATTPSGVDLTTVDVSYPGGPQPQAFIEPEIFPADILPDLDVGPLTGPPQDITIDATNSTTGAKSAAYSTDLSNQNLSAAQLNVQEIVDTGTGSTLSTGGATGITLVGATNDTLNATNGGGTLISAGSNVTATARNENVIVAPDAFLNFSGASNTVSVGQNSVFADYTGGGNIINGTKNDLLALGGTSGNFDIVNASGDMTGGTTFNGQGTGVYMSANTQINLQGSGTFVNENTSDTVGAYGGGNEINTAKGELLEIGQTGTSTDTINAANDGTGGSTANGQGTGLVFLASSYGQVAGGDDIVTFDGSGDHLTSSSTNIGITQGLTNEVINGSNEVLDIGKDVSVIIDGNNDTVHGATSDDLYFAGTHDVADVQNSIVDFIGSNTGDDVDGTGDSGSDWGGSSGSDGGEDGGDGGYGGYGGYGFSKAPSSTGTNIGVIASFDADQTNQAGAQTSETARLQAEAALAPTTATAADTPVFEGATWADKTLTWSIADNPNSNGAQLSGTIGSQYVSLIQSAFQTWAAASGLKFQQVTGTTPADIELGWSTFNTGASNVLGYTGFKSMNGTILSGALISLENPADDPLATDANGQLAYSGTQTELEQLILHEIGHALGLADDSDPKSIMNAVLTASNRKLDATDMGGIEALYAPTTMTTASAAVTTGLSDVTSLASSSPATVASSLISSVPSSVLSPFNTEADQLISAMASFSPTVSPTAFIPTTQAAFASGLTLAAAG